MFLSLKKFFHLKQKKKRCNMFIIVIFTSFSPSFFLSFNQNHKSYAWDLLLFVSLILIVQSGYRTKNLRIASLGFLLVRTCLWQTLSFCLLKMSLFYPYFWRLFSKTKFIFLFWFGVHLFIYLFGDTGVWTQGLMLVRPVCYLSHSTTLPALSILGIFKIGSH
jgi:hypothetical protein